MNKFISLLSNLPDGCYTFQVVNNELVAIPVDKS